ncbi:hypothetical protein PPSIR1_37314 [Plesiocystis pacifica SIR-1]|uniref:Uncharacterized protein n=1 Tax=Plesiocystis pacifica SIR-1 TaxID=391625 RepID=A6G0M8_9BACT|nr:hypothetical protein [Plesiocystis pacifica]EDM80674.1 hypothetical protein PPSIR1_37314 [Plesiocystis pacifica SIR-1]
MANDFMPPVAPKPAAAPRPPVPPPTLRESPAWLDLLEAAPADLNKNHSVYTKREKDLCAELIQAWQAAGGSVPALIAQATELIEGPEPQDVHDYESRWATVKQAATVLIHIRVRFETLCPDHDWGLTNTAVWKNLSRWARSQYSDYIGEDQDHHRALIAWRKGKFALAALLRVIRELCPDDKDRLERFFNCHMSSFWRAFYLCGPVIWGALKNDAKPYFGEVRNYRAGHKRIAYEHIIYCLDEADTEFAQLPHKPDRAVLFLETHELGFPQDKELRERMWRALARYLGDGDPEGERTVRICVALFGEAEVIELLCSSKGLPPGLSTCDPSMQAAEIGRMLLTYIPGFAEGWNTSTWLRSDTLPYLLAAAKQGRSSVREAARELLRGQELGVFFKHLHEVMSHPREDGGHPSHSQVFEQIELIHGDGEAKSSEFVGALLSNRYFSRLDKAKLLLGHPTLLEHRWHSERAPNHRNLLWVIRAAAVEGTETQLRKQAQEFLRRKSGDIRKQFDRAMKPESRDDTQAADMIASAVEFGTEGSLKSILDRCVRWVITRQEQLLLDRAAHHLRTSPSAIPALIQLMIRLPEPDVEHVSKSVRQAVLDSQQNPALSRVFTPARGDQGTSDLLDQVTTEALAQWCYGQRERSKGFASTLSRYEDKLETTTGALSGQRVRALASELVALLEQEELRERQDEARCWVSQILAEMSDASNFTDMSALYREQIKPQLLHQAVEPLSRQLRTELNIDVRENVVRILGNIGGRVAVDALVRAVTSEERERAARQDLLAEYYLKPSKARSEEASILLKDAVSDAKQTMRLLQRLNVATFVLGVTLIFGGVALGVTSEAMAGRVTGALAGLGGLGAVLTQFLKDPLERIQRAMADLVQIQTAFTSFVWELNLNGTYIQSQYVAQGELKDYDLAQTSGRIENAMQRTIHLIQIYANGEVQDITPELNYLLSEGEGKGVVTVFGRALEPRVGATPEKRAKAFKVAVNGTVVDATVEARSNQHALVDLSRVLARDHAGATRVWVSLVIDEVETNALPLDL